MILSGIFQHVRRVRTMYNNRQNRKKPAVIYFRHLNARNIFSKPKETFKQNDLCICHMYYVKRKKKLTKQKQK